MSHSREQWLTSPPEKAPKPTEQVNLEAERRRQQLHVAAKPSVVATLEEEHVAETSEDDAADCEVEDALLPDGAKIKVKITGHERLEARAGLPLVHPRVRLICVDLETGEVLSAYADMPKKLRPTMKFYRWWQMALGRKPTRPDRPPRLKIFVGKTFWAIARTVRTDHAGNRLPAERLHSVVDLESLA
jgi:hypothetical protein